MRGFRQYLAGRINGLSSCALLLVFRSICIYRIFTYTCIYIYICAGMCVVHLAVPGGCGDRHIDMGRCLFTSDSD